MKHHFILSCESTVDLPYPYIASRNIPVLFYSYTVDGQLYPDDMGQHPETLSQFYQLLSAGKQPATSQLNVFQYEDFFETLLSTGDVLHLVFGSGMTGSAANAQRAAAIVQERYPSRKMKVIDSLCSSAGYGLLTDLAADLRDNGASLEETAQWVLENRTRIHHQFFSTDLTYFHRSGRISGPTAMLGAVLNLCPLMRLDTGGHIIAYDKARGKKRAIAHTVQEMATHAQNGEAYHGKCFIAHANCPEDAQLLKEAIEERFPQLSGTIRLCDIGTIIAAHCGPDTVAVFFLGDERMPYPAET